MALQGDLRTVPLRDVLAWLALRQASGTLSLSRGRVARRFQLRRGHVMLSTSTERDMMLGRLLIARGLLSADQLQRALAARHEVSPRLGTALIREGLVSADDLRSVLTDKVRRLLRDALSWTDGGFYFDDRPAAPRRPTVSAVVGLADVLGRDGGNSLMTDAFSEDDVIVSDEDIIEIVELPRARRPPKPPSKRQPRKKAAAPLPSPEPTAEPG